jgi:hypothetical protein
VVIARCRRPTPRWQRLAAGATAAGAAAAALGWAGHHTAVFFCLAGALAGCLGGWLLGVTYCVLCAGTIAPSSFLSDYIGSSVVYCCVAVYWCFTDQVPS